ncbi:MAG: tagaturonate epimerase family protein [Acidobacteriota bacterium]|nr:tagaturonate epimerase family protein [Acidobacteriota bacterium]
MELEKYSLGVGDRFGYQGAAQLRAVQKAAEQGFAIAPVWNKSHREHLIAGTVPEHQKQAADEAVKACGWKHPYYVDADHIGLANVDGFLPFSNFFTIDVADFIGKPTSDSTAASFVSAMAPYKGPLTIPGMQRPLHITDAVLADFSQQYLHAVCEAGKVYRYILEKKRSEEFVTEISADEAQNAQTPVELLLLLAAISLEKIPVQTIAPKFTGSFLKGSDYVGDLQRFAREFQDDLAVIDFAVNQFTLPRNLKLSIHTGSDKFSIYPIMHRAIQSMGTGLHLKTAGTTWLEELAGIAASGAGGLGFAKEIYIESYQRCADLCKPYLAVINIDRKRLPTPAQVAAWSAEDFVTALHHDLECRKCNLHLRQLLHVGFKVAAEKGSRFAERVREARSIIEENVTSNLYDKHIVPLFMGS